MNARAQDPRRQRGSAMVEFALLQIVLVPLLLYSVFLMDAVYMKIDLQETVVSGIWDYTTRNTEPSGDDSHADAQNAEREKTQQMLRLVYSDHTSAFDDGAEPDQPGYNEELRLRSSHNHEKHHTGFGAQFTFEWENQDTQFQCEIDDADLDWSVDPNFGDFGRSGFAAGGRIRCWAEACIYNYIVPRQFLQEFSNVDMTQMELRTGDSHPIQCAGGQAANIRITERAALSFNTWAARNGSPDGSLANADIGRPNWSGAATVDTDNPFYKRVDFMRTQPTAFAVTNGVVQAAAGNFAQTAITNDIMMVATQLTPIPGLPIIADTYLTARYQPEAYSSAPVRQKPPGPAAGWMHDGFQSTPYENVNDDYRTAAQARRAFYMGCDSEESTSCN